MASVTFINIQFQRVTPPPHGKYVGLWPPTFIKRIIQLCGKPETLLEPFAGRSKLGTSIDLNPEVEPHIRADAQLLPLKDECFDMVLCDPPYDEPAVRHYSSIWQPDSRRRMPFSFYKAFREAARVLKPGGFLISLHFLIPINPDPHNFRRFAVIGISTGPNKFIRCLSIFQRYASRQTKLVKT